MNDLKYGMADLAWWVAPGETDLFSWIAIITTILLVFLVVHLYARFDRWAEEKAKGTPLATTIPTLLTIGLLYELFPLDHFSVLLPLSAIALALTRDVMVGLSRKKQNMSGDEA